MARQDLLDERGTGARQADDEDRIRGVAAASRALVEEWPGIDLTHAPDTCGDVLGFVEGRRLAQRVSGQVVAERRCILARILQRLAQGEIEVVTVLIAEIRARQLALHRGHVRGIEAEGLEVGQAPVGLAVRWIHRDRAPVSLDRARLGSGCLQHVAVARPQPGQAWMPGEDRLVQRDRLVGVADAAEDRGLEVEVARVRRFDRKQGVGLGESLDRPVQPVEHKGMVLARGVEPGREFKAAREQRFGVVVASEPRRDLGQHADRGDVRRCAPEMRAQQRLGLRNALLAQGRCRREQHRVARRVADMRGVGGLGGRGVARRRQQVGHRQPRTGQVRLQRDGAADGGRALGNAAGRRQRLAVGEQHARRMRL